MEFSPKAMLQYTVIYLSKNNANLIFFQKQVLAQHNDIFAVLDGPVQQFISVLLRFFFQLTYCLLIVIPAE